jgi:hypothetical protein
MLKMPNLTSLKLNSTILEQIRLVEFGRIRIYVPNSTSNSNFEVDFFGRIRNSSEISLHFGQFDLLYQSGKSV